MASEIARVIALGASNLTRGFQTVVSTARSEWGSSVEVLAALGHGRSYGARSRLVVRTLPGILQSDLWHQLSTLPTATTRALVTDVGNDILYGSSVAQTLAWVEEVLNRLGRFTEDIVVTELPLASVRRLSNVRFLFFRSLFVPQCRLTFAQAVDSSERVNEGLAALAAGRRLRLVRMNPDWYGVDPIHIRPALWRCAWQEILCGGARVDQETETWREGLRLYCMLPQRQWLFGWELVSHQTGTTLKLGGKVWLY